MGGHKTQSSREISHKGGAHKASRHIQPKKRTSNNGKLTRMCHQPAIE
jgi:hypothetical protein